jgi:hypothetical protein
MHFMTNFLLAMIFGVLVTIAVKLGTMSDAFFMVAKAWIHLQ